VGLSKVFVGACMARDIDFGTFFLQRLKDHAKMLATRRNIDALATFLGNHGDAFKQNTAAVFFVPFAFGLV
jgi:hypothetical protein